MTRLAPEIIQVYRLSTTKLILTERDPLNKRLALNPIRQNLIVCPLVYGKWPEGCIEGIDGN